MPYNIHPLSMSATSPINHAAACNQMARCIFHALSLCSAFFCEPVLRFGAESHSKQVGMVHQSSKVMHINHLSPLAMLINVGNRATAHLWCRSVCETGRQGNTYPGEGPAALLGSLSGRGDIEQGLFVAFDGATRYADARGRLLAPLVLLRVPVPNATHQRRRERLVHAGRQPRWPHHDQIIVRAHLRSAALFSSSM